MEFIDACVATAKARPLETRSPESEEELNALLLLVSSVDPFVSRFHASFAVRSSEQKDSDAARSVDESWLEVIVPFSEHVTP